MTGAAITSDADLITDEVMERITSAMRQARSDLYHSIGLVPEATLRDELAVMALAVIATHGGSRQVQP